MDKSFPLNGESGRIYRRIVRGLICLVAGFGTAFAVPADFDGDGRSDLSYFEPDTGNWSACTMDGVVLFNGQNWGWNEAHPVPGDYDGDGETDLAVYHRESGNWYIRKQDGTVLAWAKNFGYEAAHAVIAGDYDGNGSDDLAVYDPDSGKWFISTLSGDVISWGAEWGWSGAHPVPGDYDGDGEADLALYDRSTGAWNIRTLGGLVVAGGTNWGFPSARAVPGDYDGDGADDLAVYDARAGVWFIRTVSGKVLAWNHPWGFAGARAVPGDYDGDGADDLAVYSGKDGVWYIQRLDGTVLAWANTWGGPGRTPIGLYGNGAAGCIVLSFGDSITYGRGSSRNGPLTGYPRRLDARLETAIGGLCRVINVGVPGEATTSGRTRLNGQLATYRPDLVCLLEGVNDLLLAGAEARVLSNLGGMIDTCAQKNAPVVLGTLCPLVSRSFSNRDDQHVRVLTVNPGIRALAVQKNVPLADLYPAITGVSNWRNVLFDANSSIHPNNAGYEVIRNRFLQTILEALHNGQLTF